MKTAETLCFDSQRCTTDSTFFAFPSQAGGRDGQDFIQNAIDNGARTVCCRRNPDTQVLLYKNPGVRFIYSDTPQIEFAKAQRSAAGEPDLKLKIIGITGTDGKTTTAEFLYTILNSCGVKTALLSTVSIDDGTGKKDSPYRQSTPEANIVFPFLERCADNGVAAVVLEATSHALSKEASRLYGIKFTGAVYTSISSEHLEFHKSLENYVDAKLNLARNTEDFVLVPDDGAYNNRIQSETEAKTYTYSLPCGVCSFCYDDPVFLKNAEAARKAASLFLGKEISSDVFGILKPVKGRFEETVLKGRRFIIDFAHTADAYKKLFSFVRSRTPDSAIITVFSSAGQRDREKRALMGKTAAEYSQTLIITNEDPRNEGFGSIASDLLKDADTAEKQVFLIPERFEAVLKAAKLSKEGDTVLLLGKGHEKTIEFENGRKEPWDERAALKKALSEVFYG